MVTGGTQLHDQKDTNLCAYFATMSALRHQLRKIIGSKISGRDTIRFTEDKYVGLDIDEYLNRRDKDEKRFERDLATMIGCVCPRALSGRLKLSFHLLFK